MQDVCKGLPVKESLSKPFQVFGNMYLYKALYVNAGIMFQLKKKNL